MKKAHIVDETKMPAGFPCHSHPERFWAALGRTVATLGTLQYVLTRGIFALTGTRQYPEDQIEQEFEKWLAQLERSQSNSLSPLIDEFIAAANRHPELTTTNIPELETELRLVTEYRNVLCHAHWPMPNSDGTVIPHFKHHKKGVWQTPVDHDLMCKLQADTAKLCIAVVNVVTHMGYQFPGTLGPGKPIVE